MIRRSWRLRDLGTDRYPSNRRPVWVRVLRRMHWWRLVRTCTAIAPSRHQTDWLIVYNAFGALRRFCRVATKIGLTATEAAQALSTFADSCAAADRTVQQLARHQTDGA